MKKLYIIVVFMIALMLSSCSSNETILTSELDIEQIRSVCDLATLECYYHNVAKSVKPKGEGFAHVGEKDRDFWIEYTGTAEIGIDMSEVSIDANGIDVVVTIPAAKLLRISIDPKTLNENSYISSGNGLNKNPITAEDQTKAIKNAQKQMEESVKNNKALLFKAQDRAKKLIESHIVQIGKMAGIEYNVSFEEKNEEVHEEIKE